MNSNRLRSGRLLLTSQYPHFSSSFWTRNLPGFGFLFTGLLAAAPLRAADPMPALRLENLPATDGSIQQSLVTRGRAGDLLRIERSDDLLTWTPETLLGPGGTVYSIGQEVVVPMRQFTPPATPPPPGGPPATPATFVSLYLQPSSGPGGGTLVSWPSLATREALTVRIAGGTAAAWDSVPILARRFGDFSYFIWRSPTPAPPPAENSALGSADAAMLAHFEANLATLNSEVAANAAAAQNTPPPASPAPGSRRWWRVVSTPTDSDGDGTCDALEFEMMADPAHGSHALASVFNDDENHDDIPDGDQLDYDGDGLPDNADTGQSDPLFNWSKDDPLLFAFFPTSGSGLPLQVNDQGKVLYENSVWAGGSSTSLGPGGGQPLRYVSAIGIGDNGFILGRGETDLPGDNGPGYSPCLTTWPALGGEPQALRYGDGLLYPLSLPVHGSNQAMGFPAPSDMLVNRDGKFMGLPAHPAAGLGPSGLTYYLQPDGSPGLSVLKGQAGSAFIPSSTDAAPPPFSAWVADNGLYGGTDAYGDFRVMSQAFEQPFTRVALLPNGLPIILAGYPGTAPFGPEGDDGKNPNILYQGAWIGRKPLEEAVDFSALGKFAITRPCSIWYNGEERRRPLAELAPGLTGDWVNPAKCRLVDTTRHGWTLALREGTPVAAMLGSPVFLHTAQPAKGLDTASAAASDDAKYTALEREGNQAEFWAMVPAGGSLQMNLRTAATAQTPIRLEPAGGVTVSPATISTPETSITFSAPASAAGTEVPVNFKAGSVAAATVPLRLKVMKARVVDVNVWPLKRNATDTLPTLPTKPEIEAYLNGIYQPQLNITFNVTIKPTSTLATDPGGFFVVTNPPTTQMSTIAGSRTGGDIRIFIMGSYDSLHESAGGFFFSGITNPDEAWCWLATKQLKPGTQIGRERWMNLVGHEIGHVMLGGGHPNQSWQPGRAGLPETTHRQRLMNSQATTGKTQVKAEWDKAEGWLNSNIE